MGRIIYEGVLFDRAELEYRMKHKLPPFDSATEERRKARATDSRNASTPVEKFTVASTPSRKGKKVMATGWKVTRKSLRKTVSATSSEVRNITKIKTAVVQKAPQKGISKTVSSKVVSSEVVSSKVVSNVSKQGRLNCPVCRISTYQTNYDISRHVKVHLFDWDRPFPCRFAWCTHRAIQKSNLDTHERTHNKNVIEYACKVLLKEGTNGQPSWACEGMFKDRERLDRHRRDEHGWTTNEITHDTQRVYKGANKDVNYCTLEQYVQYHHERPPLGVDPDMEIVEATAIKLPKELIDEYLEKMRSATRTRSKKSTPTTSRSASKSSSRSSSKSASTSTPKAEADEDEDTSMDAEDDEDDDVTMDVEDTPVIGTLEAPSAMPTEDHAHAKDDDTDYGDDAGFGAPSSYGSTRDLVGEQLEDSVDDTELRPSSDTPYVWSSAPTRASSSSAALPPRLHSGTYSSSSSTALPPRLHSGTYSSASPLPPPPAETYRPSSLAPAHSETRYSSDYALGSSSRDSGCVYDSAPSYQSRATWSAYGSSASSASYTASSSNPRLPSGLQSYTYPPVDPRSDQYAARPTLDGIAPELRAMYREWPKEKTERILRENRAIDRYPDSPPSASRGLPADPSAGPSSSAQGHRGNMSRFGLRPAHTPVPRDQHQDGAFSRMLQEKRLSQY